MAMTSTRGSQFSAYGCGPSDYDIDADRANTGQWLLMADCGRLRLNHRHPRAVAATTFAIAFASTVAFPILGYWLASIA